MNLNESREISIGAIGTMGAIGIMGSWGTKENGKRYKCNTQWLHQKLE